jgi:hypothetical protein
MNAYLNKASEQYGVVTGNIEREGRMAPKLTEIAAKWRLLADAERKGVHGQKGDGPNANTMDRAAAGAQQSGGEAYNRLEEAKRLRERADNLMHDMTLLANDTTVGTAKGQQRFVELSARHSKLLTDLDNLLFDDLADIGIVNNVKNSEILRVALEQTTADLMQTGKGLREAHVKPERVVYEPITRAEAVIRYGDAAAGGWVMAIACDFMPFMFFLLIMLAMNDRSNRWMGDNELVDRLRHAPAE